MCYNCVLSCLLAAFVGMGQVIAKPIPNNTIVTIRPTWQSSAPPRQGKIEKYDGVREQYSVRLDTVIPLRGVQGKIVKVDGWRVQKAKLAPPPASLAPPAPASSAPSASAPASQRRGVPGRSGSPFRQPPARSLRKHAIPARAFPRVAPAAAASRPTRRAKSQKRRAAAKLEKLDKEFIDLVKGYSVAAPHIKDAPFFVEDVAAWEQAVEKTCVICFEGMSKCPCDAADGKCDCPKRARENVKLSCCLSGNTSSGLHRSCFSTALRFKSNCPCCRQPVHQNHVWVCPVLECATLNNLENDPESEVKTCWKCNADKFNTAERDRGYKWDENEENQHFNEEDGYECVKGTVTDEDGEPLYNYVFNDRSFMNRECVEPECDNKCKRSSLYCSELHACRDLRCSHRRDEDYDGCSKHRCLTEGCARLRRPETERCDVCEDEESNSAHVPVE